MARPDRPRLRSSRHALPLALALPLAIACQPGAGTEEPPSAAPAVEEPKKGAAEGGASTAEVEEIDYAIQESDRAAAKSTAEAGNRFGDALYAASRGDTGNLFMSPLSVRIALAMTYGGAKGETAEEMAKVLKLEGSPAEVHGAMAALQDSLEAAAGEGQELAIANRLWGRSGEPFVQEYLQLTRSYYGAALEALNFGGDPEGSRQRINAWIGEKTAGMIPELISKGVLDKSTVLVLTNAIYFKGRWLRRFDPANTKERDFRSPEGVVKAPMMFQKGKFFYGEGSDAQALEMPYEGERLSMVVVLPREVDGLAAVEAKMAAEGLSPWLENGRSTEVEVMFPRFKAQTSLALSDVLKQLGIVKAFGGADFSGISSGGGLQLSEVIHQAVVEVNEEGTEAAAATAVIMTRSAVGRPTQFIADRPFLFAIRDRESEAVLFVGRLVKPD